MLTVEQQGQQLVKRYASARLGRLPEIKCKQNIVKICRKPNAPDLERYYHGTTICSSMKLLFFVCIAFILGETDYDGKTRSQDRHLQNEVC
jgi:hypothetical protein